MIDKIVCAVNYFKSSNTANTTSNDLKKEPIIFIKPPSVLRICDKWDTMLSAYLIPSEETYFECELVFKLGYGGYRMTPEQALASLSYYTVGLDMTLRRDFAQQKKAGHPYTIAKVFPDAAIIGPWLPVKNIDLIPPFAFSLDSTLQQQSHISNMLISPVKLLVYISKHFVLEPGDIVFTGTPSGSGPVHEGSIGHLNVGDHQYSVIWSEQNNKHIYRNKLGNC